MGLFKQTIKQGFCDFVMFATNIIYWEDIQMAAQSIAYILSHPYPRELFALYLQGSSLV